MQQEEHKNPVREFEEAYFFELKKEAITPKLLNAFKEVIWKFYLQNKRPFPWRETVEPYCIVVSEIMLQQTQTSRVVEKYLNFIKRFPTFQSLANASFSEVLKFWVGLGYNRRAQSLHLIAQRVVNEFNGTLPECPNVLETFKGLGPATASSIVAFAFNKPTVFIETNVRAVFLHTFFKNKEAIHDKQVMPLIALTVDESNPREWYYALMDYGVFLKKTYKNPSKKSKHHTVQQAFKGSNRQIRGAILRLLTQQEFIKIKDIKKEVPWAGADKIATILSDLSKELLIIKNGSFWKLS